MVNYLQDVTGFRGEKILELRLTNFEKFKKPLFRPAFLGDKWPTIDFLVELPNVRNRRPYFFGQAKATVTHLGAHLKINVKKADVGKLLRIPGPTYIFGIHEPSERVFVRAVHSRTPRRGITRIPIANELTADNLRVLRDEVKEFWDGIAYKPKESVFS